MSDSLQSSRDLSDQHRVSKSGRLGNHRLSAPAGSMQHFEDRGMFSRQHTRQLSASPPPFSCSSYSSFDMPPTPRFSQTAQCLPLPQTNPDAQAYQTYQPHLNEYFSHQLPAKLASTKPAFYGEDEMSPFSMSYASMAGIDVPYAGGYQEQPLIHVRQRPDASCRFSSAPLSSAPSYRYVHGADRPS